jgi:hypothetical protein
LVAVSLIADTSPLQYLFQVGLIDLLPSVFETVQVPELSGTSYWSAGDAVSTCRSRGLLVDVDPDDDPAPRSASASSQRPVRDAPSHHII